MIYVTIVDSFPSIYVPTFYGIIYCFWSGADYL